MQVANCFIFENFTHITDLLVHNLWCVIWQSDSRTRFILWNYGHAQINLHKSNYLFSFRFVEQANCCILVVLLLCAVVVQLSAVVVVVWSQMMTGDLSVHLHNNYHVSIIMTYCERQSMVTDSWYNGPKLEQTIN